MTWLVQEIWLWMALAALAGALLTGFFSTTEIRTERWVPAPVPDESADEVLETAVTSQVSTDAVEEKSFASPFPELQATSGLSPWEDEELWTRPTREVPPVEATSEVVEAPGAPAAELIEEPVDEPADDLVVELEETPAEELVEELVPTAEADEVAEPLEAPSNHEVVAEVEARADTDTREADADETAEVAEVTEPVEELSPAEKIRVELARLEAEMAKREQLRRELAEQAQQAETEPGSAVVEAVAPARKPRKRATPKPTEVVDEATSEQAEAERLEAERLAAEKAARNRARAQRAAATRAARKLAAQAETERLETERAEAEREEAARLQAEQAAAEQLEQPLTADELPSSGPTWLDPSDESDAWKQGPFGPGSAYAAFDGTAPRGCSVKANLTTKLYYSKSSRFYSRTQADVWFRSEEHAEAAGFTRWDRRGTMAHAAVHGESTAEGPAA